MNEQHTWHLDGQFVHMHMPDVILCFSTHCSQLLALHDFLLPTSMIPMTPSIRETVSTGCAGFGQENVQLTYIQTSRKHRQNLYSLLKKHFPDCMSLFLLPVSKQAPSNSKETMDGAYDVYVLELSQCKGEVACSAFHLVGSSLCIPVKPAPAYGDW